jgi:phospholipase C
MKIANCGRYVLGAFVICTTLAGCGGRQIDGSQTLTQSLPVPAHKAIRKNTSPLSHIVIIVQENRSVDNLFQLLPNANTQPWGLNSYNQKVRLLPESLTAPYDIQHNHDPAWGIEYNGGAMNGFNLDPSNCTKHRGCPPASIRAYGYVPEANVAPYYTLAETYTFADEMFQTNQGPSFPAHQYIVSGTSTIKDGSHLRAAEDVGNSLGGCDSPPGSSVPVINRHGYETPRVFPCFDRSSIFMLLDGAGISWKYYQAHTGAFIINAVDALKPIWKNQQEYQANVIVPSSRVLKDIKHQHLASVVFVTPTTAASDHPGDNNGSGPSWVASVVNAIGNSTYWNESAVIVMWDDWGGWYDHVTPTARNSYELGFRVPMIVISPYAKSAYVSHVPYEFGSVLKFVEETFGLGSLGTTDANANDLSDCFTFASKPRPFKSILAKYGANYFLQQPPDLRNLDD